MVNLLETYAPQWYTQQHHQRTTSALQHSAYKPLTDTFLELHELLENYGPIWYTQQHHESAASVREFLDYT